MKKILFILPFIVLILGFTAGHIIDENLQALLKQFKIEEAAAKSDVLYAVSGPSFYIPNVKVLRDLAVGDRISLIESIGKNVKEYVGSKEFVEKYNQLREDRKPTPPEAPKYSAQLKEEQKQSLSNSIAEMEKSKSQMAKDQQATFDDIIKGLKDQLKEIDNPDNPVFTPEMDVYIKQGYDMQMSDYKNKVTEWEAEYPVNNPKPMIQKWINAFLEKSADINFDAKTTKNKDGMLKFVDQQYEYKDSQWKLYYRAGKESVTAARSFAQNWLKEL
jgi:hypothetical protein